jgi:hypothetical protein
VAEEGNGRISVSRADLRADLADLRNDLKDYISEQLDKKADAKDLQPLASSVASLNDWRIRTERGEFTEAQQGTISRWVEHSFKARAKDAWSGWERKLVIFSLFIGLMGAIGGPITTVVIFR